MFCKVNGSTTILLWLCFIILSLCHILHLFCQSPSQTSILALLLLILLQRFPTSRISLCTRHSYFFIICISFFCIQIPKACVQGFLVGFVSCWFLVCLFVCCWKCYAFWQSSVRKILKVAFLFIPVPKESHRIPSRPRISPSSEVPQTKPGKYILSLFYPGMCILQILLWSVEFQIHIYPLSVYVGAFLEA